MNTRQHALGLGLIRPAPSARIDADGDPTPHAWSDSPTLRLERVGLMVTLNERVAWREWMQATRRGCVRGNETMAKTPIPIPTTCVDRTSHDAKCANDPEELPKPPFTPQQARMICQLREEHTGDRPKQSTNN